VPVFGISQQFRRGGLQLEEGLMSRRRSGCREQRQRAWRGLGRRLERSAGDETGNAAKDWH